MNLRLILSKITKRLSFGKRLLPSLKTVAATLLAVTFLHYVYFLWSRLVTENTIKVSSANQHGSNKTEPLKSIQSTKQVTIQQVSSRSQAIFEVSSINKPTQGPRQLTTAEKNEYWTTEIDFKHFQAEYPMKGYIGGGYHKNTLVILESSINTYLC